MRRLLAASLAALVAALAAPAGAQQDLFTLNVRGAALTDVILLIARAGHFNIVPDATIPAVKVAALALTDVPPRSALEAVEQAYHLREVRRDGYIRLVPADAYSAVTDPQAGNEIVTLSVPSGNAQQLVQPLQVALPSATVIATATGRAVLVSGPHDVIVRAQDLVGRYSAEPAMSYGAPVVVPVSNLTATDLVKELAVGGYVDGSTYIIADDPRSRLLVRGTSDAVGRLRSAVAVLDAPIPQVTFTARVLDVIPKNDSSNVGLQYGGLDLSGKPVAGSVTTSFHNHSLPIYAQLNALISEGSATVLAEPDVAVLNGHDGKILIGQQYPIAINNGTLVGGSQVQFVQIGVQLQLTPTIGADGTIKTDMTTTFSELQGIEPVSGYPIIGQRTVTSTVTVKDGEPIIIGGLFQDFNSATIQRIPVLSKIPVFGGVFKNRATQSQRDQIVFAIYPQIGAKSISKETFNAASR